MGLLFIPGGRGTDGGRWTVGGRLRFIHTTHSFKTTPARCFPHASSPSSPFAGLSPKIISLPYLPSIPPLRRESERACVCVSSASSVTDVETEKPSNRIQDIGRTDFPLPHPLPPSLFHPDTKSVRTPRETVGRLKDRTDQAWIQDPAKGESRPHTPKCRTSSSRASLALARCPPSPNLPKRASCSEEKCSVHLSPRQIHFTLHAFLEHLAYSVISQTDNRL